MPADKKSDCTARGLTQETTIFDDAPFLDHIDFESIEKENNKKVDAEEELPDEGECESCKI